MVDLTGTDDESAGSLLPLSGLDITCNLVMLRHLLVDSMFRAGLLCQQVSSCILPGTS